MNSNQPNADNLFGQARPEERPENRDPLDDVNPISLLKKPDELKQAFFSMVCLSTEAFKAKNYERAALALTKCTDMLELGRNILKDINRYWKLVVFANLACSYHYSRKLSKCNKFCEKVKEQIERILSENPQKETFLKLARILIKLKFQHCAILSQLEQHNRAFELCKSTLPMLKQYIQTLLTYVEGNSSIDLVEKRSSETVHFSKQVHKFAETLLTDLLRCINEPMKKQERTTFYYWQKNPQQNEEQVKKKFIPNSENSNCKRSILGVSKSSHWIDEFNIGTIMHFQQMSINDFETNIPIQEYLFKDRLYEMVIYCSMANFTMATELRLIESTQQDKEEPQTNAHNQLLKKYGYEQKSELFKLSQIYHLRSIEIMSRNIKINVPYITHIIRSYEKHYIKYKKILEPIAAIVEESALSINESVAVERVEEGEGEEYYQSTYSNYVNQQQRARHQYQECEPVADLLLESQRNPQEIVNSASRNKEGSHVNVIQEEEEEKKELKDGPELNSMVEPKKQEPNRQLLTVKSDGAFPKVSLDSPKDNLDDSGVYLKSHRSRAKKPNLYRQKSHTKGIHLRNSNPTGKSPSHYLNKNDYNKDPIKQHKKATKNHHGKETGHNDYKLKTEKATPKEKERKTIKHEVDADKYRQKQIKIKTESCTHIKVTYKKKK